MSRGVGKSKRLFELVERLSIQSYRPWDLAHELGVSQRTIERDLHDLRELGYQVVHTRSGYSIRSQQPPSLHPIESLALLAAGRLLYHQAPTPLYRGALEKLAKMLPETPRQLLLQSAQGLKEREGESRVLERVAQAFLEQRRLRFEYKPVGSSGWHPKEVEVYFLEARRLDLSLYAIGWERSRRRVSSFKLARIRNPVLLEERYAIPPDFDPTPYLQEIWEKGDIKIRLRFHPQVAWRVHEGGRPRQLELCPEPDGSLLATLRAPRIRGYGAWVEVLEPDWLRKAWREEARRIVERYP